MISYDFFNFFIYLSMINSMDELFSKMTTDQRQVTLTVVRGMSEIMNLEVMLGNN